MTPVCHALLKSRSAGQRVREQPDPTQAGRQNICMFSLQGSIPGGTSPTLNQPCLLITPDYLDQIKGVTGLVKRDNSQN